MSIGFNVTQKTQSKKLQIPSDFRHALILGETGSGKTASVINPLLMDRMKKNHGILVFDFKGNYHFTVKALAKKIGKLKDVIELGKIYGKYVNLIKDLPTEAVDKILRNSLGHSMENKFWDESAIQLGTSFLGCIKYLDKIKLDKLKFTNYKYNFKTLIETARNARRLRDFKNSAFVELNKCFRFSGNKNIQTSNYIKIMAEYCQNLNAVADDISLGKIIDDNEKTVLMSVIASLVNPIGNLNRENINIDEINILNELSKGKIIIVSLNDFSENSLNAIVLSIFLRIYLFKMSYPDFPLTIIMDEAQKVLNNNFELPLDVLREYQVEVVLATQSIANLKEKLNTEKVNALLANLVHKIYLKGQDMQVPKHEAYYNGEYYKLTPLEVNKNEKFLAEYEYQKKYTKLKGKLPFKYKNKKVIYSRFNDLELLIKDENLRVIGKTEFFLRNYSKEELKNLYPDILDCPINEEIEIDEEIDETFKQLIDEIF